MKNYKANNNNCYNGYNNNNSNAINTSKSCNNHPQKSNAVPAANEFLKSIGLPILRNENICMPFTMEGNDRYLRNQVTIDKIKADEMQSNKRHEL